MSSQQSNQQPIDQAQLDEIQRQVEKLNENNIDPTLLQSIVDQLSEAIQSLAPSGPSGLAVFAALTPAVALLAAIAAAVVGALNLKHQRKALEQKEKADDKALGQKEKADAKAEWWRRIQWALAAVATENNDALNNYGAAVLNVMAENNNLTDEERDIFEAVTKSGVDELQLSTLLQAAGDFGLLSDDLNEVDLDSLGSPDETVDSEVADSQQRVSELVSAPDLEPNIVLNGADDSDIISDPVVESRIALSEVAENEHTTEAEAIVDTAGNPVDNEVTSSPVQGEEVQDDAKNIRPEQES